MRRSLSPLAGTALWRGQRVGLLGGSFNPAHEGHLHASLEALRQLHLDWVWWLVSPQNPLKDSRDMAPFSLRYASAAMAARHPRIRVSDLETRIRTRFTADTIMRLKALYPRTHFVWLMGADNLIQFTKWQRWRDIVTSVPVAVVDRPQYSTKALTAGMPRKYSRRRCFEREWKQLATTSPPAWAFVTCPRHPASATQIRADRSAGHADIFLRRSRLAG